MTIRDHMQDSRIGALEAEHRLADGATTDVLGSLTTQVLTLQKEVARQNVMITVLTQTLIEKGALDGANLKARYDQAMQQAAVAANFIVCARCRKSVDRRATRVSEYGTLCDACHNAAAVDP